MKKSEISTGESASYEDFYVRGDWVQGDATIKRQTVWSNKFITYLEDGYEPPARFLVVTSARSAKTQVHLLIEFSELKQLATVLLEANEYFKDKLSEPQRRLDRD